MKITKKAAPVPALHHIAGIAAGNVYVARQASDGSLESALPKGKRVVLETAGGGKLELTTLDQISGTPTSRGTYLDNSDLGSLSNRDSPEIRLYRWSDTLSKITSGAGMLLLLPAVLALLTAAASLYFLLGGLEQPPGSVVADQAQAVVAWENKPGAARGDQAIECLLEIGGHKVPAVHIPGVKCAAPTIPWWRSKITGSFITGAIAVCTALVGVFGLRTHYGFGKST